MNVVMDILKEKFYAYVTISLFIKENNSGWKGIYQQC